MIHEKLDALVAPGKLDPWWGAYLADGPHADDYLAGAILRGKASGDPQRWAVAWAARGEPDPALLVEAAEEADRMADICGHIAIRGSNIVAVLDWTLCREDWACLSAAHKFRAKVHPMLPAFEEFSAALGRWDTQVRRLRTEGIRLAKNPPWLAARLTGVVAAGAKGWWLPKKEAK